MIRRPCLVAVLAIVFAALVALVVLPSMPARHAFHPVSNPRCFPAGTEGVDGFPMCPDNRVMDV